MTEGPVEWLESYLPRGSVCIEPMFVLKDDSFGDYERAWGDAASWPDPVSGRYELTEWDDPKVADQACSFLGCRKGAVEWHETGPLCATHLKGMG